MTEAAAPSSSSRFMKGINVQCKDLRDYPDTVLDLLRPTPIDWVRVHLLPTRRLDEKGKNGLSYFESLELLFKERRYSIIAPMDVGYTDNVGEVLPGGVDTFVEESYDFSFKAAKRIGQLAEQYGVQVLYGVENEIEMKGWLLQALPGVNWRSTFRAWATMALDSSIKDARLQNIQRGIRDAVPGARLMTNVIAEDATDLVQDAIERLSSMDRDLLQKLSIPVEDVENRIVDWRSELRGLKGKLDLEIVGLDSYPNYVVKYPVLGGEIGIKVADAEQASGLPVFNPEFGYSTYRSWLDRFAFGLARRPGADAMQLEFFRNALASIGRSTSIGTFPWVLITHVDRREVPPEEAYFGLFAMDGDAPPQRRPAFDYYLDWLSSRQPEAETRSGSS